MSRCSESLVIDTLNQSEGVPAEAESAGKENFWNGLCRKAKHTGFREIIAFNLFSLLSAEGFQFFAKHRLFLAGISFAMLYLTVLGQDSITISFVKASGVSESLVSITIENMELIRYSS